MEKKCLFLRATKTKAYLKPESTVKVVWNTWESEVCQCSENYYKKFIWKLSKAPSLRQIYVEYLEKKHYIVWRYYIAFSTTNLPWSQKIVIGIVNVVIIRFTWNVYYFRITYSFLFDFCSRRDFKNLVVLVPSLFLGNSNSEYTKILKLS